MPTFLPCRRTDEDAPTAINDADNTLNVTYIAGFSYKVFSGIGSYLRIL